MEQIEKIEAILEYFETGKHPSNNELASILTVIDKLREGSPKDYLVAYKGFLEWKVPLLQRTTKADGSGKPDLKFD